MSATALKGQVGVEGVHDARARVCVCVASHGGLVIEDTGRPKAAAQVASARACFAHAPTVVAESDLGTFQDGQDHYNGTSSGMHDYVVSILNAEPGPHAALQLNCVTWQP